MTEGEGGMHVRAGAVGADYAGRCVDTCDAFSYLLRLSLIQPQVLRPPGCREIDTCQVIES